MASDFLSNFFCDPILQYSGYNIVNTLIYGIILLVVAFKLVYPFFTKKGISFDARFLWAVLPYIVLGSSFRIYEDLKLLPRSCNPLEFSFYTISPGIYILIGILTILALGVSIIVANRTKQSPYMVFAGFGVILAFFNLVAFSQFVDRWWVIAAVPIGTLLLTIAATIITAKIEQLKTLLQHNQLNQTVFFGQVLDGFATFTAIQFFNFGEQHVFSNFIIQTFSPVAFLIVKILLMLAVLYFIDKEIEDKNLAGFIKIFVAIIGFAPGIRDTLLIGVGLG